MRMRGCRGRRHGYRIPDNDNGTAGGIHDEPDIGFDAADFDIGFVSNECISFLVGVLVDKGFDADSCGLTVVGDLLVGDADVIQILKSWEVLRRDSPRLTWRVRHRDMTCALCLLNFREEAFLGREFKSILKNLS